MKNVVKLQKIKKKFGVLRNSCYNCKCKALEGSMQKSQKERNMRLGRRLTAILLVTVLIVFSISAKGANETQKSDKAVIKVFHYMTQNSKQAGLLALEEEFMKANPNVTFENIFYNQGTDYFPQLQTAINSGDVPEIIMGNPSIYPELIENGYVADLTGDAAIASLKLSQGDVGDCSYNGIVYAYPVDYKTWGVFYNTAIFKELGLEIPKTASELQAISKKIEAAGYDVWADWYKDGASVDIQTRIVIWTQAIKRGDTDLFAKLMSGARITDYPYIQESLDDWAKRLEFHRNDALSNSQDQAIELFVSGKAAMMFMGSWSVGDIEAKAAGNPNFEYAFFPCPCSENPADVVLNIQIDDAFMINPKSKNYEIAKAFMQYWITDGGLTWSEISSQPLISGQSSDKLPKIISDIAAIKKSGNYVGYGQFTTAYTAEYTSAWRKGLTAWAENVITGGKKSSDTQIKEIQKLYDDIRAIK